MVDQNDTNQDDPGQGGMNCLSPKVIYIVGFLLSVWDIISDTLLFLDVGFGDGPDGYCEIKTYSTQPKECNAFSGLAITLGMFVFTKEFVKGISVIPTFLLHKKVDDLFLRSAGFLMFGYDSPVMILVFLLNQRMTNDLLENIDSIQEIVKAKSTMLNIISEDVWAIVLSSLILRYVGGTFIAYFSLFGSILSLLWSIFDVRQRNALE